MELLRLGGGGQGIAGIIEMSVDQLDQLMS
jgi:hypothetical protein